MTLVDLVDLFLVDCAPRVEAGELKPTTVDNYYVPNGKLLKKECGSEKIAKLISAAHSDVADVLRMLVNCPIRPGDCFALSKNAVDLKVGILRLDDSKYGQRLRPHCLSDASLNRVPAIHLRETKSLTSTRKVRADRQPNAETKKLPRHTLTNSFRDSQTEALQITFRRVRALQSLRMSS